MIRHGTPRGYDVDGCRCDDCTAAMAKYRQQTKLRLLRGEQPLVPIGPTLNLARLKAREWECSAVTVLATAMGVEANYASVVMHDRKSYVRIDRGVYGQVAALRQEDMPPKSLTGLVDEARTLRDRLMGRRGWTMAQAADAIGTTRACLRLTRERCRMGTLVALREAVGCWKCGDEPWAGGRYCALCSPAAGRAA